MNDSARILVLGATGLVGGAITRLLQQQGYYNLLLPTRQEVDLQDQQATRDYFSKHQPEYVFFAAARVGGILGNALHQADFGYQNGIITLNVLKAAADVEVKKLLYLGSSCIYPKDAPQPIKEEYLLTSELEPTNHMYALSKIFGLKLCNAYKEQYGLDFISCMPCNLYGPGDTFNEQAGHVLPALMMRFHQAKLDSSPTVTCWGSGKPRREFMHVDDCAAACLFLMNYYSEPTHINAGTGKDYLLSEIAELMKEVTGYQGEIVWDTSKPDGTMRKCLDVSKIDSLGWKARYTLEQGLKETYQWFLSNQKHLRKGH